MEETAEHRAKAIHPYRDADSQPRGDKSYRTNNTVSENVLLTSTATDQKSQASQKELQKLTDPEQKSLWVAFSEARREIRPVPESRAEREENLGYDFYALHPKQNLTTRFGTQGVQFISSDRTYTEEDQNHPTTSWAAQMHVLSLAGKAIPLVASPTKTEASSTTVQYQHTPELTEWYHNDVTASGTWLYPCPASLGHLNSSEDIEIGVALNGLKAIALHS